MLKEYYNKYFGSKVILTTKTGKKIIGTFYTIDSPDDTEYDEWCIGILINKNYVEEYKESEIKKMEYTKEIETNLKL